MKKLILSVFLTIFVFGIIFAQNAAEGQKLLFQGITAEQKGENLSALALYIQARTADKKNIEIQNHIDSIIEVIAKSSEPIQNFNKKSSADLKKSMKLRGEWDKIRISLEKLFEQYSEEKILSEYIVGYYTEIQIEELTPENYSNETVNLSVKAPFLYRITNPEYSYEKSFAEKLVSVLKTVDPENEWRLYLKTERLDFTLYSLEELIKQNYKICLMNGKKELGCKNLDFIDEDRKKYSIVFKNIPMVEADTDKIMVSIKPAYTGQPTLKIDKNFFCTAENLKKKYFAEMFKAEELIKNIPEGETKTIKIKGEFNKYLYPFSRLADSIRQCKGYVDLDISETIKLRRIGYDYDCWDEKPIGNNGLKDCIALIRIVLPKKDFYYLDYGAFLNCSSLREVELSENIEELGGDTFKGCNALTEICIPKTVSCLYEAEIAHGNGGPFGFVFGSLNDSSIQKIYYAGSIVDWEKIKTVSKWKYQDDYYYNDRFHRNDVNYNRIEIVYDCPAWKLAEIKKEEAERLIAEKQAEKERLAAEEAERKAAEAKKAAEQKAQKQYIQKLQSYYDSGVVPAEDAAELLQHINFYSGKTPGRIVRLKIVGNVANEMGKIQNVLSSKIMGIELKKEILALGTPLSKAIFFREKKLNLFLDLSETEGLTVIEDSQFLNVYFLSGITLPTSIVEIKKNAFNNCYTTINYTGTKKQWKKIKIDKVGNETLLNAKINYEYKTK